MIGVNNPKGENWTLTIAAKEIINNIPWSRRQIFFRDTESNKWLSQKLLQLGFQHYGLMGLLFRFLYLRSWFLIRITGDTSQRSCKSGDPLKTNPSKSESSSISIASAASLSHFFSWFSFFTLCCIESIFRASCTRLFNLSSKSISIGNSGIDSPLAGWSSETIYNQTNFRLPRPRLFIRFLTTALSSGAHMSKLKPSRKARAVRPQRWTYASAVLGVW